MRTLWKVLIGLAVVLPTMAYVAGTLAATGDQPAPRDPVVIEESGQPSPAAAPTRGATEDPTSSSSVPSPARSDDDDDDGPETISARPDDLDDHDDDEGRDDDRDDGNHGHGGSGSGSSGRDDGGNDGGDDGGHGSDDD
jgi:hypothetical protein